MKADVLYNKIIPNERKKRNAPLFIKSNHKMFIIETKKTLFSLKQKDVFSHTLSSTKYLIDILER